MPSIASIATAVVLSLSGYTMAADHSDDTGPRFAPLPGEVTGLFIFDKALLGHDEGRTAPEGAVPFVSGVGSFRWVYIEAPGDPEAEEMSFGIDPEGQTQKTFKSVLLATARRLRPQGFTEPFHLVRVQVNGGAGSSKEESFVATSIKRLDGSKEYSLKPKELLKETGDRAKKYFATVQPEIERSLAVAKDSVASGRKPPGPEERNTSLTLTWLPKEERVRVEVRHRVTNGFYVVGQGVEGPKSTPTRVGTQFGTSGGVIYEVGKDGRVEQTSTVKFAAFTKELLPPQRIDRP